MEGDKKNVITKKSDQLKRVKKYSSRQSLIRKRLRKIHKIQYLNRMQQKAIWRFITFVAAQKS